MKSDRTAIRFHIALWLLLALSACGRQETATTTTPEGGAPDTAATVMTAGADLTPTQGNNVRGSLTFAQEEGGVRITGQFGGLTEGDHGIHLHEIGDCSAPDASSAGDHWNPTAAQHGGPESPQHHLGDLGNIHADASGNARMEQFFPGLSLQGDQALVGKSVVVHANPDDLTSQPSGGSGARVACGVIMSR